MSIQATLRKIRRIPENVSRWYQHESVHRSRLEHFVIKHNKNLTKHSSTITQDNHNESFSINKDIDIRTISRFLLIAECVGRWSSLIACHETTIPVCLFECSDSQNLSIFNVILATNELLIVVWLKIEGF